MTNIQIYPTLDMLTHAASEHIITLAQTAINQRGRFSIALSGGSTPKPVYERLAAQKDQLDWTKVHIFWSDERCVPPNHPDSNYHMAHEALLRYIEHECGNIHRLRGEIDPQEAAVQYEAALKSSFSESTFPRFDLILLGMGDDGHTASLFPHTAALNETERWCVANHVEKLDTWRLTFTPPLINAARQVIFLVSGKKKAAPLYQVLHGEPNPQEYPSQLIQPNDGALTFLVDQTAAAKLPLRVLYLIFAACLLVIFIGGFAAEPHGLRRTFYSGDTLTRSDTWGWLAFDGADYRDEDVADRVGRVTFEGVIWQPQPTTWRVVHTGGVQLQIDGETVLNAAQRQPLTHTEIDVQSGWRTINATYNAGLAEYDIQGRRIEFGVVERDLFGQWQNIPSHRLYSVPSDTDEREGWIYALTRLALVGAFICAGVWIAAHLPWRSRDFWVTGAMVLFAWLIRYVVLWQRSINDPFFYYLVPGSDNYVLMARETLMGSSHLAGAFFSPGNTLWMIALTTIFGTSLSTLYLINATLGALSIGFIVGIAQQVGGRWTAILAGIIAAVFPPLIFYHTTLQLEATLSVLLPLSLWLGIRALRQPTLSTAAVFGSSVGIITLFRMTSAVIGVAYVLALLASPQTTWRRKFTLATVAALTALLTIMPQTVANLSVGQVALVNTNGPDTFYWGINRDGNGADVVGEAWYLTRIRRQPFTAAALEDLRDHPLRAVELTLHKWGLLWSNTDIANNVDYQAQGLEASPLLNTLSLRGIWGAVALLAFGLTGATLLLTEKTIQREVRLFLVGGFALFTLATIAFTVFGRMRVPLWVMLCFFAAYTLNHLLKHRIDRRLVIVGMIAAALLIGAQGAKRYLPRKPFFTDEPQNTMILNATVSDSLRLVGYTDLESRCGENGYVFLSLIWEVLQSHTDDQTVVLALQDDTGNVIAQRETTIGSVSYPPVGTSQWERGAKLEEKYMILIPNDAPQSVILRAADIPINDIDCSS